MSKPGWEGLSTVGNSTQGERVGRKAWVMHCDGRVQRPLTPECQTYHRAGREVSWGGAGEQGLTSSRHAVDYRLTPRLHPAHPKHCDACKPGTLSGEEAQEGRGRIAFLRRGNCEKVNSAGTPGGYVQVCQNRLPGAWDLQVDTTVVGQEEVANSLGHGLGEQHIEPYRTEASYGGLHHGHRGVKQVWRGGVAQPQVAPDAHESLLEGNLQRLLSKQYVLRQERTLNEHAECQLCEGYCTLSQEPVCLHLGC